MSDEPEYKAKFTTMVHAYFAVAMVLGSPFAAFWSFGAAIMFFLVGSIWVILIGVIVGKEKSDFDQKKNKNANALRNVA